jgi:hypothetical protein
MGYAAVQKSFNSSSRTCMKKACLQQKKNLAPCGSTTGTFHSTTVPSTKGQWEWLVQDLIEWHFFDNSVWISQTIITCSRNKGCKRMETFKCCLKCVLQSSTTNTNCSPCTQKQNMKTPTQTGYEDDNQRNLILFTQYTEVLKQRLLYTSPQEPGCRHIKM